MCAERLTESFVEEESYRVLEKRLTGMDEDAEAEKTLSNQPNSRKRYRTNKPRAREGNSEYNLRYPYRRD